MTKFEKHVVQSLTHNATLFMKEAIRHILSQSGEWRQDLSTDDFDIQLRNNDFTQGGLADKHVQDFNLEEMYDGCNEEIE